jgi:hypothetical protein
MSGMEIGVAHARGLQLDQDFAVAGGGQVDVGDLQGRAEFGDDGGTHRVGGC